MKEVFLIASVVTMLSLPSVPAAAFTLPEGCERVEQSPINNGIAAVYVGASCPWAAGSPLRTVPSATTGYYSRPEEVKEPRCEPKEDI